ncbi:MAG: hypothetical protein ACKVTZ_20700 [Bacteroidia bacterium]
MMNRKSAFLLIALLLPVLVFVFLKFFGKNEFAVVPLFQTAESKLPSDCLGVTIPYFVSDSAYINLKQAHELDSILIIFYEATSAELTISDMQLTRLTEYLQLDKAVGFKRITQKNKSVECALLLKPSLDLALLDSKKRIRGQYNSNDRDEVDRLMTELDIILKRY